MSALRFETFSRRKDPPKIKSIPPTNEATIQHIKRARLQVMTWCAADKPGPPKLDIRSYGWHIDKGVPVTIFGTSAVAPEGLLKVVACSCHSKNMCKGKPCTCNSSGLSFTSYCKCEDSDNCKNPNSTSNPVIQVDEDEGDDE